MNRKKKCSRVLLVEDDAINMELLQAVLEGGGFDVLTAPDAPTGINLAQREQPDAILMDVQMPEMDGLQATRILQTDPTTAHIPIIAVTAHVKQDDAERCLEAGCALHLPKPLDTRALPKIVARAIKSAMERTG
ncbi:MAG: response regulator [Candidatus Latescibacterota bacterium]|nr:MAG: response regulator [Candidatus Latescibacterota bacterium]